MLLLSRIYIGPLRFVTIFQHLYVLYIFLILVPGIGFALFFITCTEMQQNNAVYAISSQITLYISTIKPHTSTDAVQGGKYQIAEYNVGIQLE